MDDLISRSALLAAYDKAHQGPPGGARKLIENAPDAIVRCKDCMHSCDYTDIYPYHAYKCIKNGGYHNDSWFCADGKRTTE